VPQYWRENGTKYDNVSSNIQCQSNIVQVSEVTDTIQGSDYWTVQLSAVQWSTVQNCTILYSIVQ